MRLALLLLLTISVEAEMRLELTRQSLTRKHCRYREYLDGVPTDRYVTLECGGSAAAFESGSRAAALQPARVFPLNPVATLNDPSLRDSNDSPLAVPEHAYENTSVDLLGPYARIVDLHEPRTAQPDPSRPLMFDRGDDRFEAVNAVFHIDRMQRHLQSLGYFGSRQLVAYPIQVDPLALNGADASQFLPSMRIGQGTLFFGTGGTDDAEDADLVVHEYGHAILEWIAPGTFSGSFGSESRALSEGIGDYLAFSAHYAQRIGSGRDAFCFADWDARCWTDASSENCAYPAGSDCLRRLDSARTMAGYQRSDNAGAEHRNGEIWSSALRDLHHLLGRRTTDTLVIESLFGAPPRPTYAVMARRLVETDRLLNNAVNGAAICRVMNARGIGVSCDGTPRGELTHVQSGERNIAIPELTSTPIVSEIVVTDSRTIESVAVRVDLEHPSRGDLRIALTSPDGSSVLLMNPTNDFTADVHVTFGIDAVPVQSLDAFRGMSAAGRWTLAISDFITRDAGTLQSWSLVFRFAGDDPKSERPRGEKAQMIPVVSHVFGPNVTPYASDVRIANITETQQTATLIFTRSGDDGTRDFSAVNVAIDAGATVSFDDIVSSLFHTTGSGSLEVLGDVLVSSRLYTTTANGGKLGQEVPANLPSSDSPLHPHVNVSPPVEPGRRYNLGMTEVAGVRTQVRFGDGTIFTLEPFSHVQVSNVTGATISLVETAGRVVAYVSEIDDATGDLTFFPGQHWPLVTQRRLVPAIGKRGADGTLWSTDVWAFTTLHTAPFFVEYAQTRTGYPPGIQRDAVQGIGPLVLEYAASYAGARINTGKSSQYVPLRELDDSNELHLIGIDNDATHRANIGFVSDASGFVQVLVYDAAGELADQFTLFAPTGLIQGGVTKTVTGGRAVVRRITGGRIRAYASVIDRRSGDAAFVDGQ